jgi:hypothetical protein
VNSNNFYKLLLFLTIMICFSVLFSQAISFPDTDGDGITDKLEIYAGLNPKEDECQPRKCRGISIQGSINGEYLILLVGQNLSMKEKGFNGESKLDSIKSVVKEHIQYSPNFIKIGAYTYGRQGCSSLDEIQSPFKSGSKSYLIKEIESLNPLGSSSIATSLDRLFEELKDKNGKFNILIIGDGSDTCEGNVSQSLQNLLGLNSFQRGIKVFFAGVNLSPEKSIELGKIFDSPHSKFIAVNSNGDLKKIFDHPIKEVINSLRGMVCIQVELDDLIRCESNKINQLKRISLKKLSNPIDKDFSIEEKDYLLQQIPVVESRSKIKLKTYDQFKKDSSGNYQKKIIELSKIINLESRQE